MEILRIEKLCKVYGKGESRVDALQNLSLSVQKGEFVAIVGQSGSGKIYAAPFNWRCRPALIRRNLR